MKFMKLGSKLDSFQTDGNNVRYVGNELATDIIVNIGDVKYYLHKFPLLSKSSRLQKLVSTGNEICVDGIPGGLHAFEICAKFCYGMTVTLSANNVVSVYCAAEYLGMHEDVEKGNLVYKIEVFLKSSIFRSWKDSIIVLQTTTSFAGLADELNITSRCIDAIASKACVGASKVDWSYTYDWKKLAHEEVRDRDYTNNGVNGITTRPAVPEDWWVEDLCELEIDLYKQVVSAIYAEGGVGDRVIGRSLKAYACRRLPDLTKKTLINESELETSKLVVDTIVWLLPVDKSAVSCSFLLDLFKSAMAAGAGEMTKGELIRRIGPKLEEASVNDLLIRAPGGEQKTKTPLLYDVDTVQKLVEEFRLRDDNFEGETRPCILSDASKLMVAMLIDDYLAEIAKDPNLPLSKFLDLARSVSDFSRSSHDRLYRAIDTYLKEHPAMGKTERKKICKLMDCRKLSSEASMHGVQNERLPLRVVVQLLFFEQLRSGSSGTGSSTPELLAKGIFINGSSNASSMSVTTNNSNTEEDWDAMGMSEEVKALRLRCESDNGGVVGKIKGLIKSKKLFSRVNSNGGSGSSTTT